MVPSIRTHNHQDLAYASGGNDQASDMQPNNSEFPLDAMTLQPVEPLGIGDTALTANISQSAAGLTYSLDESSRQASTNEEVQWTRSVNIYAGLFVFIVYTMLFWKESFAMQRYDIIEKITISETIQTIIIYVCCHCATTFKMETWTLESSLEVNRVSPLAINIHSKTFSMER